MAVILQPWIFHVLVLVLVLLPSCYSQSNSNQNIETFFPFAILSPPPTPSSPRNLPVPPSLPPRETPVPVAVITPPSFPNSQAQPPPDSSKDDVAKAVAATAASTLVVTALAFLFVRRFVYARRRRRRRRGEDGNSSNGSARRSAVVPYKDDGDLNDFIVDENGLDVLYWRNLEAKNFKLEEEEIPIQEKHGGPIQEIPLLRGKSSTSHLKVTPEVDDPIRQSSNVPPPPPPPPISAGSNNKSSAPAPPPPPPPMKGPPPPPKGRSLNSLSKPTSPEQKGKPEDNSSGTGQVKLKPLHWDKVNMANADHSMVWDKINDGGSFR